MSPVQSYQTAGNNRPETAVLGEAPVPGALPFGTVPTIPPELFPTRRGPLRNRAIDEEFTVNAALILLEPAGPKGGTATAAPGDPAAPSGAAAAAPPGGGLMMFLPFLVLIPFFFFMNRKNKRDQEAIRTGMKKGDRVTSASGLVGDLIEIDERFAKVKIAPGVNVTMTASSISPLEPAPESKEAKDAKDLKDAKPATDKK